MKQRSEKRKHRRRVFLLEGTVAVLFILLMICLGGLLLAEAGMRSSGPDEKQTSAVPAADFSAPPFSAAQSTSGESLPPQSGDSAEPGWRFVSMPASALGRGDLVLVNSSRHFDSSYAGTVNVFDNKTGSYFVCSTGLYVSERIMESLNGWLDAFSEETGTSNVNIIAGYRDFETQRDLYDRALLNRGVEHAHSYLALPGYSEHHTGLAVDLGIYYPESGLSGDFTGTGVYRWLVEHAWEYGFIRRYPEGKSEITGISYESWHFRYVGTAHAYYMQSEDLCLEEYIELLKSYPFDGEHLTVSCGGSEFEIYYCGGFEVAVPLSGEYLVSGNNCDGFIVTVEKQ
ncbi:MAG: M15 family metallopeptidase [Clostridiales bacterium]|nr:M15 family metallopeptidase [Clostridiales bacterium]